MQIKVASVLALGGLLAPALVLGCDPPRGNPDASRPPIDALVMRNDAFMPIGADAALDAPVPPMDDAFVPGMPDAGLDAFAADMADAFSRDAFSRDAFVPSDAPFPTTPCEQITAIRARTGTFSPGLPVTGAIVSYVMPVLPAGATDPRGVFVQCPGTVGPALFIAIAPDDATAFPTAPSVGQRVSFQVTEAADSTAMGGTGDQHRVIRISGWTASGAGSVMSQDVRAVALPAMIDAYESELISLDGVIAGPATAAGTGFTSFQITTTGVGTATADFRLRMPVEVASAARVAVGCSVSISGTPLWRFTTTAQPSVWSASEITVSGCPAACTPPSHLVINELDYDQTGADTAEFVELFNPTAAAIDLTGHSLVAINGSMTSGPEYARIDLTGSIAAGSYLVVSAAGSTAPGATMSFGTALQNGGPDGILLVGPAGLIDTAIYEGTMTTATLAGGMVLSLTETGSVGNDTAAGAAEGLSRMPNGCDRDTAMADWVLAPTTPGAAN